MTEIIQSLQVLLVFSHEGFSLEQLWLLMMQCYKSHESIEVKQDGNKFLKTMAIEKRMSCLWEAPSVQSVRNIEYGCAENLWFLCLHPSLKLKIAILTAYSKSSAEQQVLQAITTTGLRLAAACACLGRIPVFWETSQFSLWSGTFCSFGFACLRLLVFALSSFFFFF